MKLIKLKNFKVNLYSDFIFLLRLVQFVPWQLNMKQSIILLCYYFGYNSIVCAQINLAANNVLYTNCMKYKTNDDNWKSLALGDKRKKAMQNKFVQYQSQVR